MEEGGRKWKFLKHRCFNFCGVSSTSPISNIAQQEGFFREDGGDHIVSPPPATFFLSLAAAFAAEEDGDSSTRSLICSAENQNGTSSSEVFTEETRGVEEDNKTSLSWRMCCVCMERDKGAAFIPCGHAFCLVCCRKLKFSRGSCPLCDSIIADVLRIF